MSHINLTSHLIENAHLAQIIHQNGTLIFANTAAARLFGFDTIAQFVKFAKVSALFGSGDAPRNKARTRIMNFRGSNGQKKSCHIVEKLIDWHGSPSCYLTLKPLFSQAKTVMDSQNLDVNPPEETYLSDTFDAALDWARSHDDVIEVKNKPFDFAGTCLKLCEELQGYAKSKNVSVHIEIKPQAQKIFFGDGHKMARAASCLVRHAIDRTPTGYVAITLRAGQDGDHIMFEVCDMGPSYTPKDAQALFDANPAPPKGQFPRGQSMSVDLRLARCIAHFLGGEIALKISHPAGGLIRMRLPFQKVEQNRLSMRTNGQSHRKLDVLIVEDNVTSQHVIKIILDALGHRPTVVSNGKECLDILLQANFDIILMDLHMPIQDGYSAIQHIRARESSGVLLYDKPIPILAITADRRPETRARALHCGVNGFLAKPIHIPQIMAALAPFIDEVADPIAKSADFKRASRGA